MKRMNPTSYGPTEPQFWLVGKIPPKTSENCRETCEWKAHTHSYDDPIGLQMELATEEGKGLSNKQVRAQASAKGDPC